MTDLKKLEKLLKKFGVSNYTLENGTKYCNLCIERGCCDKVGGYIGFYTYFTFDINGCFCEMGAEE
jgi:hypothetical protein